MEKKAITREAVANALDGQDWSDGICPFTEEQLKENGLVVIFGQELEILPTIPHSQAIQLKDWYDEVGVAVVDLKELQPSNTPAMSREVKNQCPEFPFFGATYPDATCIDGYLWDLDSNEGGCLMVGGDVPCPFCNTDEFLDGYDEAEKDSVLQWIDSFKLNEKQADTKVMQP